MSQVYAKKFCLSEPMIYTHISALLIGLEWNSIELYSKAEIQVFGFNNG